MRNRLILFGKRTRLQKEFNSSIGDAVKENTTKLCDYCKEKHRQRLERWCADCSRRLYRWGSADRRFKAFKLEEILEELVVVKAIIVKNLEASGTKLSLKFFESIMSESQKSNTIYDLTPQATMFIRRWAEKSIAPLDLLVVAAAIYLTYYLETGKVVSDRNLPYVVGNHLIRMVAFAGSLQGASRRLIGALVNRQIGPFLITVAKTGIDYMNQREAAHQMMFKSLEMPDKVE